MATGLLLHYGRIVRSAGLSGIGRGGKRIKGKKHEFSKKKDNESSKKKEHEPQCV